MNKVFYVFAILGLLAYSYPVPAYAEKGGTPGKVDGSQQDLNRDRANLSHLEGQKQTPGKIKAEADRAADIATDLAACGSCH